MAECQVATERAYHPPTLAGLLRRPRSTATLSASRSRCSPEYEEYSSSARSPSPSGSSVRLDTPPLPSDSSSATFACQFEGCGKVFTRLSKLQEHSNVHTGDRPFVCKHPGCGSSYRSKSKLQAHAKSHLTVEEQDQLKTFSCDRPARDGSTCGKRFWTGQHLDRHIQGVHDDGPSEAEGQASDREPKQYQCREPGCQESFSKRKKLRKHIWDSHTDRSTLVQSEDAAMGDPPDVPLLPFPCLHPGCGKRFPTNSKRKSHYKTHIQDRYTCALPHPMPASDPSSSAAQDATTSLLSFPTWSALQAHMRGAHPPTCPYESCNGKVFKNRENLKLHIRRHEEKQRQALAEEGEEAQEIDDGSSDVDDDTDSDHSDAGPSQPSTARLRTFVCGWHPDSEPDPCGKSFKSKYALDTHHRVAHLNDRPFTCPCGKAYGHKHLLKRHEHTCQQAKEAAARASLNDADSDLESDEEDDVFRRGGGALPEELREQSARPSSSAVPSRRRKRVRRRQGYRGGDDDDDDDFAAEETNMRLVDLLTGRAYEEGNQRSDSTAGPVGAKRQRRMRGRVVSCPAARCLDSVASSSSTAIEDRPCQFRFSRLYDVQRHLRSKHQIDLPDETVSSLLTAVERKGLAPPRKRKE